MAFDLFSIGHSNISADRFVALLRAAGVDAIADVRSTPCLAVFPVVLAQELGGALAAEGMAYSALWRRRSAAGRTIQASIATASPTMRRWRGKPDFRAGLDRLQSDAARRRVCLMCAEREPLDCHRCLLVARALAERGLTVGHILHDGTIEPHKATEQRLMAGRTPRRKATCS